MKCESCGFKDDDKLKFYRVQVRGLRYDSNKTTGKSERSELYCEPCCHVAIDLTRMPKPKTVKKNREAT